MNVNSLIAARNLLESENKLYSKNLKEVVIKLSMQFDIPIKDDLGLTPDKIKFHPEYVEAKNKFSKSFEDLRKFNSKYAKVIHKSKKKLENEN